MNIFDKLKFKKNKEEEKEENIEEQIIEFKENIFKILGKPLLIQMSKYGTNITKESLSLYLEGGDVDYFTSQNQCRSKIANLDYQNLAKIINFVYPEEVNMKQKVNKVVDDVLINAKYTLDKALKENIKKYGDDILEVTINNLLEDNYYSITADNNARENIEKYGINSNTLEYISMLTSYTADQTKIPKSNRKNIDYLYFYMDEVVASNKVLNSINMKKLK